MLRRSHAWAAITSPSESSSVSPAASTGRSGPRPGGPRLSSAPLSSSRRSPSCCGTSGSRRWRPRSEERRVGKECRSRWSPYHEKKKTTDFALSEIGNTLNNGLHTLNLAQNFPRLHFPRGALEDICCSTPFEVRPVFFFQAEDGIRDGHVTGVQTCALPICKNLIHVGPLGSGHAVKIVNNSIAHAVHAVVSEGLALGEAYGVEPARLVETLRQCSAGRASFELAANQYL